MLLLTQELKQMFQKIGRQEEVKDPIVIAKFFFPMGRATWYATEFREDTQEFFGYVISPL